MQTRLQTDLPDWQERLRHVMQVEETAFATLLDALDAAISRA
jgi:chemotaxis regulatin CheY-phosphate phosphatase CheZ